jgi:hypothetical protein
MNRLILASLFAVACATPRAEELTEAEHRAEMRRHVKKAQEEQAKYNPGASMRAPARTPFTEPGGEWIAYNPTERYLEEADAEMREAADHAKAAAALSAFEDESCKGIAPAERAACPLLASQVREVQQIKAGLVLVMKDRGQLSDIHARLACHLAYATANGFDQPSCPLFVRGMVLRKLDDKGAIEMTAPTPEVVKQLHQEARRLFTGKKPVPVSSRSP